MTTFASTIPLPFPSLAPSEAKPLRATTIRRRRQAGLRFFGERAQHSTIRVRYDRVHRMLTTRWSAI